MNRTVITAIATKDIKGIFADSRVWLGLLLLPLLFGVIFPAIALTAARFSDITSPEFLQLLEKLEAGASGALALKLSELNSVNTKLIYLFLNYLLAPLFLLIPVLNAVMISTNSFVGEKERNTLETLLYAPIDIKSLFVGKVLASFVPSYGAALASFGILSLLANGIAGPMFDGWLFPGWNWMWLILWVAPNLTITVILVGAFISARVKTFQQAQSIGGLVVLPLILLGIGQAGGLVLLNAGVLAAAGLLFVLLNLFLLSRFAKMNQRHILFERQVH